MTLRDPYTGMPKAPRPPRPFAHRWWPVLLIAAIAAIAGFAEWQNTRREHSPAAVANGPTASAATTPAAAPGAASAAATLALTKATDQLERTSELLTGIAALQVIVLAGQLYLLGRQRRAARDVPE